MNKDAFSKLHELNRGFCEGTIEYAIETETYFKRHLIAMPDPNPEIAVYRCVWNADGSLLFVIDVDAPGKLETAFYVAKAIYYLTGKKCLVKFSGHKGFHVAQHIDFNSESWKSHLDEINQFNSIQEYLKAVLRGITTVVDKTTTDEKIARKKGIPCLDLRMFEQKRLIRGFSYHLKSGLYSVPVFDTDELEDVLKRAKLEAPLGIDEVVIPEFNLYGLAQLSTVGKHSTIRREPSSKNGPVEEKTHSPALRLEDNDNVPPCIEELLRRKAWNPRHFERLYLTIWLIKKKHSKEEILETIRGLGWSDYDPNVTDYQVGQIMQKGYIMPGPVKLIGEGICTLPSACKKCVMKSTRGGDEDGDDN